MERAAVPGYSARQYSDLEAPELLTTVLETMTEGSLA